MSKEEKEKIESLVSEISIKQFEMRKQYKEYFNSKKHELMEVDRILEKEEDLVRTNYVVNFRKLLDW